MTGIILYGSFELAPYSKKYMKILDDANIEYDLIGWRREERVTYTGGNVYMYEGGAAKRYSSVIHKILPALGFRRFVKRLIRKKGYDKLIILTTQTGLMLFDVLLWRYRDKYIFDYRDRSYEYIKPYGALVNAIVKGSVETVISSPWFASGLTGKKEYIKVHNLQTENLEHRKAECIKKKAGEKIVVGYVGALRSYSYHKRLIDIFSNDKRFEFHTYGCGDDNDRLTEYAAEFDNTFVHGTYSEAEKYGILDTFDSMCYNYPYSFVNDTAVANKYYDSLIMKKPMFVNSRTQIGRFIAENGMGLAVDENEENITDRIYEWYNGLDPQGFVKTCDFYLDKYTKENGIFEEKISRAIK